MIRISFRRLLPGMVTALVLAAATVSTSLVMAAVTPAQAQVSVEFQAALEPYGHWVLHPRWGEVWVPDDVPLDWQPYTDGHWVYTDEWGWYWVSDEEEEDWGWVVFHYGRWAHDRRLGWFWVPGDEWAPAWVDWRRGDDYVGWAPAPPNGEFYEYDDEPIYWVFVRPRYLVAPRLRTYLLPRERSVVIIRRTVVINRTVVIEHDHRARRRIAVNAGISPAIVAAARRRPVETFRIRPRVLAGTHGVAGALTVRPQDFGKRPRGARAPNRALAPVVERTSTAIQPTKSVPKPTPLGKNERGRLGTHPPRAAQGGTLAPPAPATRPRPPQHVTPPPQLKPQRPPSPPPAVHPTPRRELKPTPPPAAHPAPPPVRRPAPPAVEHRAPPPVHRAPRRELKPTPPPAAHPAPPPVRRPPPPAVERRAPPPVHAAPPVHTVRPPRPAAPPHPPAAARPARPHPPAAKKPERQKKPDEKK